jgi:hypothetical protein
MGLGHGLWWVMLGLGGKKDNITRLEKCATNIIAECHRTNIAESMMAKATGQFLPTMLFFVHRTPF